MKAVEIRSVWSPRQGTKAHPRDIERIRAQQGSRAWKDPEVRFTHVKRSEPRDSEVLIRVRAAGLCGSDVSMAATDNDGYMHYPFMVRSPVIPGHEFSGEVIDFGQRAAQHRPWLKRGVPITAQCVLNCGECDRCAEGETDRCAFGEELGFTHNGSMAEYCTIDVRHVHSLAPLLDCYPRKDQQAELYLSGSLIEPLAGTFKALTALPVPHGGSMLIIGAGPIGIAAMLVAKALGYGTILVAEVWRERRVRANRMGAWHSFCPVAEKLSEAVMEQTRGRGVDTIFEASGYAEKNWDEMLRLFARQEAKPHVIFFGQSKETLSFNPQDNIQKFAVFSGSHGHTKVWGAVIRLVATGRINPLSMVTRTIALHEAPGWLARLRSDKSECKVTITEF